MYFDARESASEPLLWHPNISLSASPPVLSMSLCTLNSDEEKSKHAGLDQENGFSPAYLLSLLRLGKSAAKLCTC
jgi:hypothetical protein